MSLYADYLRERTNDEIIETEAGFATYRFVDASTVYIVDIYVKPEFRLRGVAGDISDKIVSLAKKRGCSRLIGSVVPSAKGSTNSLKALLGYGFKLDSSTNDFVVFSKEI